MNREDFADTRIARGGLLIVDNVIQQIGPTDELPAVADTVIDGVTGFAFEKSTPRDLLAATARALACWRGQEWDALRRRCMRLDHSWSRSAGEYEEVYREAIRGRVGHEYRG